jgi:hypothetical protein
MKNRCGFRRRRRLPLGVLGPLLRSVHHRCITTTLVGGLSRHGTVARTGMVERNRASSRERVRRIPLRDRLTEAPQMRGFPFQQASPVHQEIGLDGLSGLCSRRLAGGTRQGASSYAPRPNRGNHRAFASSISSSSAPVCSRSSRACMLGSRRNACSAASRSPLKAAFTTCCSNAT